MKIQRLKVSALSPNVGQIPGLPTNPRQWTKEDVERIATSLKETPELFEARPLLVFPLSGAYVILGGNLRFEGAVLNGETDVPAIVFPETTPVEKLKEIVLKDNGSFGAWDYDVLANQWDDLPLTDWGVPAWDTTPQQTEEEPSGPSKPRETETLEIELSPDELNFVKRRLLEHGNDEREGLLNLLGYETECS